MKVAALGRTAMLFNSIRHVSDAGHEIVLIGTCADRPEYSVKVADFEALAKKLDCPFFCCNRLSAHSAQNALNACDADVAISVNWLTVIQEADMNRFQYGILNAHAGDLPRFRGNAAPNWAILHGEPELAVTVHQMAPALDAGPVCLKSRLPLDDTTYVRSIYDWLEAEIPVLFARTLNGLDSGSIIPEPQSDDPMHALRCLPRRPEDGVIDWEWPAERIHRLVRASGDPLPGAYTWWNSEKLYIHRAHFRDPHTPHMGVAGQVFEIDREAGHVTVLAGDNRALCIEEVSIGSDSPVAPVTIIRSLRDRLGADPDEIHSLRQEILQLKAEVKKLTQRVGKLSPEDDPQRGFRDV